MMFGRLLAMRCWLAGGRTAGGGREALRRRLVRYAETMENLSVGLLGRAAGDGDQDADGVVMSKCNVESDNSYAESLLKAAANRVTGQPGTWANGSGGADAGA